MNSMRAIMIDPKLHRVVDIELAGENEHQQLVEMRRLIGGSLDHTKISDLGDYLWLADNGLLQPSCFAFRIRKAGPFAGVGIIIGSDRYGNSRPPFVSIEMIENDCDWLDEIIPEIDYVYEDVAMPNGTTMKRISGVVTYRRVK